MKKIKYIIGYIDWNGAVFSHVVRDGDKLETHREVWPEKIAAHGKWRWDPTRPTELNTYGEDIDLEDHLRVESRIFKLFVPTT